MTFEEPTRAAAFPLFRYFIVWSVTAALLSCIALAWVASVEVETDLLKKDDRFAEMVADVIQRQVLEHFPLYLKTNNLEWDIASESQWREICDIVNRNVEQLGIARVNFYDADGKIVFSTEQKLVGTVERSHGFIAALNGTTHSEFMDEDDERDAESPKTGSLLESYVTADQFKSDGHLGTVVEIYQESRPYLASVRDSQFRIIRIAVMGLLVFFTFNFLIVRRGAREINRERERASSYQHDLEVTNKALADLTMKLEERVQEATRTLIKAERLAAVGRLSAGMAHEVNTPLASIAACAEGLQRRSDSMTDVMKKSIEIIRSEAFRCKEITRNLLDFARRESTPMPEEFDLRACMTETVQLVGFELQKRNIRLVMTGDELPTPVRGHPNEMKQVFLNVLRNAMQASERDSSIAIDIRCDPARQNVVVTVRDEGHGIAPEDQDKIFEPFFTTKPPGEGTGLGLAVSYGIIERHSGMLRISSPGLGRGATVEIALPLLENAG